MGVIGAACLCEAGEEGVLGGGIPKRNWKNTQRRERTSTEVGGNQECTVHCTGSEKFRHPPPPPPILSPPHLVDQKFEFSLADKVLTINTKMGGCILAIINFILSYFMREVAKDTLRIDKIGSVTLL